MRSAALIFQYRRLVMPVQNHGRRSEAYSRRLLNGQMKTTSMHGFAVAAFRHLRTISLPTADRAMLVVEIGHNSLEISRRFQILLRAHT